MIILVIYVYLFGYANYLYSNVANGRQRQCRTVCLRSIDTHKDSINWSVEKQAHHIFCPHSPTFPHTPTNQGSSVPEAHVFI